METELAAAVKSFFGRALKYAWAVASAAAVTGRAVGVGVASAPFRVMVGAGVAVADVAAGAAVADVAPAATGGKPPAWRVALPLEALPVVVAVAPWADWQALNTSAKITSKVKKVIFLIIAISLF